MEKEDIKIGKIYNIPKRFCIRKDSFANMSELFKCVRKNKEGCLFSPIEGMSEELFIKNGDLMHVEETKNG
ncbi:MAG: hypothetical protein CO162_01805 [bacterium (Candidatus Ratteibacteria) CG_4_9_14_3_um_filter_41_21]|uniref:Uncharacterized protein n=2 Tax=Candidatus Ratteibacteria TaxID=2979319 RepID=A0A2M7YH56_9BACT|nr:MAG: hypothetical protein COW28_00895 [bacterium (Candidatus Ratteibacteria) CG15_BIG_FIL_POST_REV_8_21_14_020_41_12]PJA62297.1 MAG: hypothetical protein CO162_01805 [bacterium (Candidatus Ratteibacteria) CG_4_9_14_3_um_filter_41_21]